MCVSCGGYLVATVVVVVLAVLVLNVVVATVAAMVVDYHMDFRHHKSMNHIPYSVPVYSTWLARTHYTRHPVQITPHIPYTPSMHYHRSILYAIDFVAAVFSVPWEATRGSSLASQTTVSSSLPTRKMFLPDRSLDWFVVFLVFHFSFLVFEPACSAHTAK